MQTLWSVITSQETPISLIRGMQGGLSPKEDAKEDSEEEPDEDHEVELADEPAEPVVDLEEEEFKRNDDENSDAESEVINPPYMARVSAYRMALDGPRPMGTRY